MVVREKRILSTILLNIEPIFHKMWYCFTSMFEAKNNERTNALKEVKLICKKIGFTAGMLKGSLAEGRKTVHTN